MASTSLRRAAGEVLIVGVSGTQITPAEAAWLKLIQPAGIILFRRNIETPEGVFAFLKAAAEQFGSPLLRVVDLEGGTVDRLRDLIAPMPSAYAVGLSAGSAERHGRLIGRELRMLGFNVTFAPVLDLRTDSSRQVLGTRALSSDPGEVTMYAKSFLDGLSREGVLGCGKHFPGLGSGQVDSHHATPEIQRTFASLWAEDLVPYRKLASNLDLIMISHASYPQTTSRAEPASISRFWVTEILKKKIGYRGLVVSDDMEMGGILSRTGIGDAAVLSILAGVHVIEICHDPARIFTTYEALLSEAETSPAFARRLLQAATKTREFKANRLNTDKLPPRPPTPTRIAKLRAEIQRFAAKVENIR